MNNRTESGASSGRAAMQGRPWLALAVWAAITLWGGRLQAGAAHASLQALVTQNLLWGVALAAAFMAVVAWRSGWWQLLGFQAPRPTRALWLLWLPGLYVMAMFGLSLAQGLPAAPVLLLVLANTLMVGFSEELAFRGVAWGAVRRVLPFWAGFFLVGLLFGSVHVFNGLITGEWADATNQALNAFMSGALFLALRIRLRSIVPVMVLHGLWDCALFLIGTLAAAEAGPTPLGKQVAGGLALVGPLLVYALLLVRSEAVRAGWRDDRMP
ncbi:lysostaphin resistance A-like protein [Hydrogenophaga sp.]|uniref:CPBP family intramembrane glutamic endopeptidase n=1 Tax=Hydrogenophaga sp. TaxID=1904254 RepID=UPI0035B0A411